MTDLEWEIADQLEVTRSYMTKDSLICNALASTHKLLELFFEYLQGFKELKQAIPAKKEAVVKKSNKATTRRKNLPNLGDT